MNLLPLIGSLAFAAIPSVAAAAGPEPSAGTSTAGGGSTLVDFVRLLGSLALVVAVFLGGAWLYRNWQRLAPAQGRPPRLRITESRSLGPRQTLHVVVYEQQKLLISASAAGIHLLARLPDAEPEETLAAPGREAPPFVEALRQALKGRR